jgi:hypothetical protein
MRQIKIQLFKYDDFSETIRKESAWDSEHERLYNLYAGPSGMSDAGMSKLHDKMRIVSSAMNMSDRGEDYKHKECIERVSVLRPDHTFKIGTIIDSVDDMGLSTVLGNLGVTTLHKIFDDYEEMYDDGGGVQYVRPDWSVALDRVLDARRELQFAIDSGRAYMVSTVSLPVGAYRDRDVLDRQPVKSGVDAIKMYASNLESARIKKIERNYYNSFGWFYTKKPLSIRAAIAGTLTTEDGLVCPCTYIVYNMDMDWYAHALDVVMETIQHVLGDESGIGKYWLRFEI